MISTCHFLHNAGKAAQGELECYENIAQRTKVLIVVEKIGKAGFPPSELWITFSMRTNLSTKMAKIKALQGFFCG